QSRGFGSQFRFPDQERSPQEGSGGSGSNRRNDDDDLYN
ncbi:unnamed protein product, partial [Rotaria magnacalcarata]